MHQAGLMQCGRSFGAGAHLQQINGPPAADPRAFPSTPVGENLRFGAASCRQAVQEGSDDEKLERAACICLQAHGNQARSSRLSPTYEDKRHVKHF